MMQAEKLLIGVVGGFLLCTGSEVVVSAASASDNPYQGIVDRNIFSLKPPPPPVSTEPPKPPPPNITLTGITTILGKKLALMKATPPPAKGEAAKEKSYMLTEGERDGDVEVMTIDEKLGVVTVNDFGTITNLTFEKNGVKLAGSSPGNTAPPPMHGTMPTPLPGGNPFNSQRSSPMQRPLRIPGAGAPAPNTGGGVTSSGFNGPAPAGYGATPSVNVNGTALSLGGNGSPTPGNGQPIVAGQDLIGNGMDPDAYAVLLEANREATKDDVLSGKMAPLPVTRYTPPGAVGSLEEAPAEPGSTASPTATTPTLPIPGRPPGFRPY